MSRNQGHPRTVLFVFHQSSFKANGGVLSLMQIISNLTDIRPIVLTQRSSEATRLLEEKEIKCYYFNTRAKSVFGGAYEVIKWNIKVFSLIRRESVHTIHANDITSLWHSFFGARLRGSINIIFNVRGIIEPGRRYNKKWGLIRYCDRIVVLSQEMKKHLIERIPLLQKVNFKVDYIYSIIDFTKFNFPEESRRNELRKRLMFSKEKFHVTFVASFNSLKNQLDFIVHALPYFREKNIVVHFVGDFDIEVNPYAKQCYKAIQELKADDMVNLTGYRANVYEYYQAADVTVVPSRREGLARCMIESLASGTPVVSFDVPSAAEILTQHEVGWVIPQGDYKQLAQTIIYLKENSKKLTEKRFLAAGVAKTLFNKTQIIKKYTNIYFATV